MNSDRHRPCGIAAVTATLLAAVIVAAGACSVPDDRPQPVAGAATTTAPTTTTLSTAPTATPERQVVTARPVSTAALARLPKATTFGVIPNAPHDPDRHQRPDGLVAHPRRTVPVFAAPGGRPIAALPATQLGADTWLPVIDERPGWLRVLLPARPNGATGWLARNDAIRVAHTDYRVDVDRARFTLTLYRDGTRVGRWRAGVGKPGAVTPTGRTFVLAVIRETIATFSDKVLPLGAHSDTHTSYGGGPGTVGIHTWPTSAGIGTASSDGCVRIPQRALDLLSRTVPLGTPVMIR